MYDYVSIANCAAINPSIEADDYAGRIVGRIVDNGGGGIAAPNNFALNTMQATGSTFSGNSNNDGVDKTDSELRAQATYSNPVASGGLGWGFGNNDASPWKMSAGGWYPKLYWQ